MRALGLVVLTVGLWAASAAPAFADDRVGGFTGSGTVVGKGHSPAYQMFYRVGSSYVPTVMPECWRLDLRKWGFSGRRCVDRAVWDVTQVGDEVLPSGVVVHG